MIAGHPGETEEDFDEMMGFIERSRFERLGIFNYSHEENTHSHTLNDDVPDDVKQQRADAVMELQQGISLDINQQKIGKTVKVLVDRKEGGNYIGRTEFDFTRKSITTSLYENNENYLRIGDFVQVKIKSATEFDLTGEVVE